MNISKQYWKEWKKIVETAEKNLKGSCPLIEDSVIIHVEEYLKFLEDQNRDLIERYHNG